VERTYSAGTKIDDTGSRDERTPLKKQRRAQKVGETVADDRAPSTGKWSNLSQMPDGLIRPTELCVMLMQTMACGRTIHQFFR
jgi:hypothetical protein